MQKFQESDEAALARTAKLLSWGNETTELVLRGLLMETASHTDRSGVNSHAAWCASMTAFGKTCLALAEREKRVHER